ncbi:MAG TPA: hypothetical protein VES64_04840 [Allosphingosinicella sp.]|nr:hypothetical protein [Allosphingosinicella sp.]
MGRLLFAAALVTIAASAAASVIVVRSSGPSAKGYPAGRSLPDNARITLRANDTLVVLGAGGTRTFRGPGTFSPSAAVRAGQRTVASSDGRRARIGAVRSAGLVPQSPTIWHVDVTQSGTFCLANPADIMLWRPDATLPTRLTVVAPGGGAQSADWPAGQATLPWPPGAAITNGAAYSFRQRGVAVPTQITFRTLRSQPANLQAVAAALIENGCREQLDLLVDSAPNQSG